MLEQTTENEYVCMQHSLGDFFDQINLAIADQTLYSYPHSWWILDKVIDDVCMCVCTYVHNSVGVLDSY